MVTKTPHRMNKLNGARVSDANDTLSYIDESQIVSQSPVVNAMSVDVEEYFQVSAFENRIAKDSWGALQSRVAQNMDRILDIFDQSNTKATFFILGWVAEKSPDVVRQLVSHGHEIASHGYDHSRVWTKTDKEFHADVLHTKNLLEDISGVAVTGYRAPSFSINGETPWAHDMLEKAGYRYSSSIYPINHDHYGLPNAPRFPFRYTENGILEIPLTTAKFGRRNWPCAGGGYFRLLPTLYSHWAIRRVNHIEKMPAAFYFHPWEIDPDQPRVSDIPLMTKFRHYVNLARFEKRLIKLLDEFNWGRMDEVYQQTLMAK